MGPFQTAQEIRDAFGVMDDKSYEDFIVFTDGKPGFSIKRPYPPDIQFKPPIIKKGSPDTVAMIRVLYNPEGIAEPRLNLDRVPLWIDISKHSKYDYSHFGYNFEDDNCPTQESLAASRLTPQPVDLRFLNHFFFDHSQNQFVNSAGQRMSGKDVLQAVFDQHCATTRRTRQSVWRSIAQIDMLCNVIIHCLEWVLRFCFRKRLDHTRNPLSPFGKDDIVLLEADSLEIFGYKTTKNVILTYAFLVLVVYSGSFLMGLSKNAFLSSIWKHPLLTLCATLVTLPLLENGGPQVIRLLANALKKIRLWSIMHSPHYSEEDRTNESSTTS